MPVTIQKLPKGMVQLTFTVPPDESKVELAIAAERLTKERPLPGYRPGKAPYEAVAARFGEGTIYETALPDIIRRRYVAAVNEHHLRTFGEPQVNVTKLVPGNDIEFTAVVAVIPDVTVLADITKVSVKSEKQEVKDKEVDDAVKELQRMQTREHKVERAATMADKIVVDMSLSIAGVPVDGGQARGHSIYLNEDYFIPGLKDKVVGMKAGDKREFTLPFPKDHFQKHLAGKDVEFEVTLHDVYELAHPAADDDFAKKLGQDTLAALRKLLHKNILEEKQEKEARRAEQEVVDKIVEKSEFGEIPDAVLKSESENMVRELAHNVASQGMSFENYLKSIKKTVDELRAEFSPQAEKRVKAALVMRAIGEKEKVEVDDAEVMAEIERQMNEATGDAERQERIRSEDFHDYVRAMLRNKKVLERLRKQIT